MILVPDRQYFMIYLITFILSSNTMKQITILLLSLALFACENDTDTEMPSIDMTVAEAFPVNCDTLYFGETFILRTRFTDNVGLSTYNINVHHNFDQHSLPTGVEVQVCEFDEKKESKGLNPMNYTASFSIPDSTRVYVTETAITLPQADNEGDYEGGDYHLMIRVVDVNGWSMETGLSIKLLHP